jgi:hypothetical protein
VPTENKERGLNFMMGAVVAIFVVFLVVGIVAIGWQGIRIWRGEIKPDPPFWATQSAERK